jgi:hypothetical protein
MKTYSTMTNVHTLTAPEEGEENVVENALTRSETVIKFLIKENYELKVESYRNKLYADEYKSYCNDLETKLDNCVLENTKLKSKLNDISTAASAAISENIRKSKSKDVVAAASAAASESVLKAFTNLSFRDGDDMRTTMDMLSNVIDDIKKTLCVNVMEIVVKTALLDELNDVCRNVGSKMKSIREIATL